MLFLVSFLNNAECQPCRKGWILFQEKCYLFYLQPSPWKTWGDSRKYCQDAQADLVVIGSLQEQVSAPLKGYIQLSTSRLYPANQIQETLTFT